MPGAICELLRAFFILRRENTNRRKGVGSIRTMGALGDIRAMGAIRTIRAMGARLYASWMSLSVMGARFMRFQTSAM